MENNSLQHFGVMGMKWGVRKDSSSGTTYSNFRKPSKKKLLLLNSYGKATNYTNPKARAQRVAAGKKRAIALAAQYGGLAMAKVGYMLKRPDLTVVPGLLLTTFGTLKYAEANITAYKAMSEQGLKLRNKNK